MGLRPNKNIVIKNKKVIGWTYYRTLPGYEVQVIRGTKVNTDWLPEIKK